MTNLNIQLPDSLHKRLEVLAEQEGISIEQFVTSAVSEKIAAFMSQEYLTERAKRASREKYDAALAQVPNVEPEEYDRLS